MNIVKISGKAECGKTYHAKLLAQELNKMGYCAVVTPLAKKLKEQAMLLGWNGQKDEKGRTLLQQLSEPIKQYHGRDIYSKWAVKEAYRECSALKPSLSEDKYVMIVDDCRMLDEMEYLQKYDGVSVRIERPGHKSALTEEQMNDRTETELDNYNFDITLTNFGTPESAKFNVDLIIKTKDSWKKF